jgi:hypothetical protein
MTHGTRSGYSGGCRCPSCTEANTQASRERRRRLAGHVPATQFASSGISKVPSSRPARGGDSGDLSGMLSRLAERFVAAQASQVATYPEQPAFSTSSPLTAFQSLPPPPPQVSRVIPLGCPAYRLIVNCGCPFGWKTPEIPDWIECPVHERQRVLSSASSDSWEGRQLALAVSSL